MQETTTPKKRGRPRTRAAPVEAAPQQGEVVVQIPLTQLHDWPDHPIKLRDDETFQAIVQSVKDYGVLTPSIVREKDGEYEIIAGRRRRAASELAGVPTLPCIVRTMDDDTAAIMLVDCSIQREDILPSERAALYKMKLDAIKRQAGRPQKEASENAVENGGQVGHDLRGVKSRDLIAENTDESARTIQRYIRLTELTPELQQMVDERKIGITPAVELSYLTPQEQSLLLTTIDSEQATPSLSQAQRMKKLSQGGGLNEDTMLEIMMEQKKPEKDSITLSGDKLRKYFPRSYTPLQMETTIFKLLEAWQRKRQRDQAR